MGTSSSYSGPSGPPPLLPPWAQEPLPPLPFPPEEPALPPRDGAPAPVPPPPTAVPVYSPPAIQWRSPKRAVGRAVSGGAGGAGGGGQRFAKAAQSYVRASGGSRAAASSAKSGRRSSAALGGFLASVARDGFAAAAATLGIFNLVGRDAQSILAALADALAPDGALREEAISRQAIIETLDDLFERLDVEANGIDALNTMTSEGVTLAVEISITNYVNARFQEELLSRVERGAMSERDANECASEIREFIETNVRLDMGNIDTTRMDWNGPDGKRFVDGQYERAYRLLGGAA